MSNIHWSPDGKKMFEKLLAAVPDAMRDMVKPKLLEFLSGRAAGKPVTDAVVISMVREDVPEPQKGMLLQAMGIKEPVKQKVQKKEDPQVKAPQAPMKIIWQNNSQSMFERMLQEVPEAMREVFRGKLMDVLSQKSRGGPIGENHVMEIVHEMVPEPFKSNILKAFATMGGVDINKVEEIIDGFSGGQENIIPILHALQAQFGYVPSEALLIVSQKTEVFLSTLYRLVTSYQAFRTAPPKKYLVTVCNGTGCHVKGGGTMLKELESKTGENGGQITLEKVRCLGCCDMSPVVMINGEIYSGPEAQTKLSEILQG